MADTLIVKRNPTSGVVPAAASLSIGELALNTGDGKLYSKNAAGTVIQLNSASAGGGVSRSVNVVSTAATAGASASTDYIYLVSGITTVTLPTAVANTNRYTIKRTGTGLVTIATTSSQTIDGSTTASLKVQYGSLELISDGANWNVI